MDIITKSQSVADCLLEKIQSGQLRGRIPSGKKIAQEYNVALMTAVKALKMLEKRGYVIRIPSKGTFAAEPQQKTLKIICSSQPSPFFEVLRELVHKWNPEYQLVRTRNAEEADLFQWTTFSSMLKYPVDAVPFSKERENRLRQQKHFWEKMFDLHCRNGLLYGVPYLFSPVLLNYNRTIMRELESGFSAAELTMEHFLELLRKASERGYGGLDFASFSVGYFLSVAHILAEGVSETDALLRAARCLKEIDQYSGGNFADGKTLFVLAPRHNYFYDQFSDYDIAPLPMLNGKRCNPVASGTLVVSPHAADPEQLHGLCELMLSQEVQEKLTPEKFGIAMDRRVAADSMDTASRRDDFYFTEIRNIHFSHQDYELDTLQEIALLVADFQDGAIDFAAFEKGLRQAMKDQLRTRQRRKRFLHLNDQDNDFWSFRQCQGY